MTGVLDQIREHAARRPRAPALRDEHGVLDYATLLQEVERVAEVVCGRRVGLLMENGCHWAITDLAVAAGRGVSVPMPGFFSDRQLRHLIEDAGLDLVVTDRPRRTETLLDSAPGVTATVAGRDVWLFLSPPRRTSPVSPLPAGTAKITYTSGTTGQPRGVCLSGEAVEAVAASLCRAVEAGSDDRALSLLPLSTLLENIGGLYSALYAGALAQVPALASCGVEGSSGLRPGQLWASLTHYRPTSVILVPQLLKAMAATVAAGAQVPRTLRFAAVGGAPISALLLEQSRSLGIPAYQGYGLSEAASVVSLNLPGRDRTGSVGRPLPHTTLSLSDDGEVLVHGGAFLGYLGDPPHPRNAWPTGDLGYLDGDGFLYLTGRRKTAYATAFGRNVAPEWVECELTSHPLLAQAAVFGEGLPFNVAVLVPRSQVSAGELAAAVRSVNARLPDYARIERWLLAGEPFAPRNGLANGAGSVNREAVGTCYRTRIDELYQEEKRHVVL